MNKTKVSFTAFRSDQLHIASDIKLYHHMTRQQVMYIMIRLQALGLDLCKLACVACGIVGIHMLDAVGSSLVDTPCMP